MTDAHRERLPRHFVGACKEARIVFDRAFGKRDDVRTAPEGRMGFVEGDMPVAAKPQKLDVARHRIEKRVVAGALPFFIFRHAVFDVGLLGSDAQTLKQVMTHEVGIALLVRGGQALVLVEIDGADVFVICAVLFLILDEAGIQPEGRRARRKPQNGVRGVLYDREHHLGGFFGKFFVIFCDNDLHWNLRMPSLTCSLKRSIADVMKSAISTFSSIRGVRSIA